MNSTYHAATIVVFLCNYLVHSTLLAPLVWWLVVKRRWPAEAAGRVQLLRHGLLAPLVTTLGVTILGGPHWGWRLPIADEFARLPSSSEVASWEKNASELNSPESKHGMGHPAGPPLSEFTEARPNQSFLIAGSDQRLVSMAARPSSVFEWQRTCVSAVMLIWLAISVGGLVRLVFQWLCLQRLLKTATSISDPDLLDELERFRGKFGIRSRVFLLESSLVSTPLAAGIMRPSVLFPTFSKEQRRLTLRSDLSAMLAHELAHVARRDALWNLLTLVVCRVFFFQPLNWSFTRMMRQQVDFAADQMAAGILGERLSLVRCLYAAGTLLNHNCRLSSPAFVLTSGMALFQSTLGQRVEALLDTEHVVNKPTTLTRGMLILLTLLGGFSVSLLAPRAVVNAAPKTLTSLPDGNDKMDKSIASLMVIAGLTMPVVADEAPSAPKQGTVEAAPLKTTPDELPAGVQKFNGMLVGRVAAKDVEQGSFTVLVDAVPRVWENSRAEDPGSIVGKTIKVSGVFGKFLDVLVVTRVGETVEFECKHDGEGLVFPGELLRKVAPFDPTDYPVLPEEFRGFRGLVAAEILKKDPETFELIIRVDRVLKTWEESSARNPKSIEGKSLMLAGFWNRREAYHNLKAGDRIEVGMRHVGLRSNHLNVMEEVKKASALNDRPDAGEDGAMASRERGEKKDLHVGFRGMLVGRLMEKDIERGTFTITVDAVPRVWENNRAANPKALIGKNVSAEGVSGRMIDALVVASVGDTIEFGALHEEGPRVRVGEVLHKVAPVKPGDYPVLPDDVRGFRGMVTAKVIRKGDELWELIVEVEQVQEVFEGSRAGKPESIVGKQVILAGFWNRKDDFHNIRVGDRIRCGMNHTQLLSDHVNVVESIRKVDGK